MKVKIEGNDDDDENENDWVREVWNEVAKVFEID